MAAPRWQVIVVAFGVTFLALVGGYRLYEKYAVQYPAEERILATGLAAKLEWSQSGRELKVYLNPVSDLREAYTELEKAAGKGVTITVVDTATPFLEDVYRKTEPALYEAAALSNFTSLARTVDNIAKASGLDAWIVQVDEDRIYLALREGKAYLYRVIPRQQQREV